MNCDVCQDNPATVYLTQIVKGEMQKVNLCKQSKNTIQWRIKNLARILKSGNSEIFPAVKVRPASTGNQGAQYASVGNKANMMKEGSAIELPEGFAEKHTKEQTGNDDASQFCTKQEYLDLYAKARANSVATIEKCRIHYCEFLLLVP